MPTLTRALVRTSFIYLVLALLAGILLAIQPVIASLSLAGVMGVYIHLFVLGWISQLIFGIVFWMFPKFSMDRPRGSEALGWITYASLNTGLVLRAIGEPMNAADPSLISTWLLVLSAVILWLAGAAFIAKTWMRVKER